MKPSITLRLAPLFATLPTATAQDAYVAHVVEPTGTYAFSSSYCSDVNNLGVVVGGTYVNDVYTWFQWSAGLGFSMSPPLFQSATNPAPSAGRLNDLGDRSFGTLLVLADGTQFVPPYVDGTIGLPSLRDLNNDRVAVGSGPTGTPSNILVWDPTLGSRTIDIWAAKTLVRVSEAGLAVGNAGATSSASRAFVCDVWTNAWTDLADILTPGITTGVWSEAIDVNEHGVVVGRGFNGTTVAPFTWSAKDGMRFLGGLDGGSEMYVHPTAIDDKGQVVGRALNGTNDWDAFLWNPQTGMHSLSSQVSLPPNFRLQEATDISETGVIIGRGFYGVAWGPDRGVILEPSTPWQYLGAAKPTDGSAPLLGGFGDLSAGTFAAIVLHHAVPSAPALLVASTTKGDAPFLGGTLVPFPITLAVPFTVDGTGGILSTFVVPAGLSGIVAYLQIAVADPTASHGVELSNALAATFP